MFHFQLYKIACFAKVNKSFRASKQVISSLQTSHFLPSNGLFLKSVKFYKKNSRVSVTPTFHLFFYALDPLPSNLDVSL